MGEERRPEAVSSVIEVVGRHVSELTPVPPEDLPMCLPGLSIPWGWRIGHPENSPVLPTRVAVCGRDSVPGWDGCEIINAFSFTGFAAESEVRKNADCTLRDFNASSIASYTLAAPSEPGVAAVRTSGYFDLVGRRIWAQYSTYVCGSETPRDGLLIEHCIFVGSDSRARLRDDVSELSDAVHEAFLTLLDTVDDDGPTTPFCQ
ncbi:MAG TPA: hypothetical protein VJ777_27035 [Mycobacterium sp.]|nr:hypothetical protein [Mycobacterium sp.]